jgi:hypothetical protein
VWGVAKAVLVGLELCVAAHLVGDLVPAVGDLLHRLLHGQLTGNVLRDGRVEDVLLVFLGLGDAHVEDHVGVLEAGLDRAEIVLGCRVAHAYGLPGLEVLEVRGAVWVEAGLAERHVLARLSGSTHIREERVGRVLLLGVGRGVDRAGPATERGERGVVDAIHGIRARGRIAGHELLGGPVEHLGPARRDDRADLVLDRRGRWVERERADVTPVHREGAAPGREQAAGVADTEVDLVLRPVVHRLLVGLEGLGERFVLEQRVHVRTVEEGALTRALRLEETAGDGDDPPVALLALLLCDARAVVGLTVAVEVLAVLGGRDGQVLVPGLRRSVEDVAPVIDHVEVAVERDHVRLARVRRVEVAEERPDVLPV